MEDEFESITMMPLLTHAEEIKVLLECYKQSVGDHKKMLKNIIDMELFLAVHDKAVEYKKLQDKMVKEERQDNVVPIGEGK